MSQRLHVSDYEFRIGAYSPKTIPLARLAQYLAQLADLIGEKDRVHFARLKEGSTIVAIRVDPEARVRSRQRIQEVRTADKDHPAYRPYRELNNMLREDDAEGAITAEGAEIIRFPGRREVVAEIVGPFNKHTEVDGMLIRIGGRDRTAHAQIEDHEGRVWSCETDRDMARRLAPYLFGNPIRVFGEGRWQRTLEGQWELLRLRITDFKRLEGLTLGASIDAIRKLPIELKPSTVA